MIVIYNDIGNAQPNEFACVFSAPAKVPVLVALFEGHALNLLCLFLALNKIGPV